MFRVIWEDIKDVFKNFGTHMRTGAAYMLPVLLIGGLATALTNSLGRDQTGTFWTVIKMVGDIGMGYFPAVLAMYMAYSIADTPGLAPGLVMGILAKETGTGYIGAMLGAVLAGILTRLLVKIRLGSLWQSTWSMFAPAVATGVMALLMGGLLAAPIAAGVNAVVAAMESMSKFGGAVMGILVGGLENADFGGPISKAAMTFVNASYERGVKFAYGMAGSAVFVAPLGISIAALLWRKYFSKEEYEYAKGSLLFSIIGGFTEIVITFAVNDFWTITIASIAGGAVAGMIAGIFQLEMLVPILGIANLPFWSNVWVYLLSVLLGSATTMGVCVLLKARKYHAPAPEEQAQVEAAATGD